MKQSQKQQQQQQNRHPRRHARNRGTAMTEAVLVMPFLLIIFSFMILYGRQMVRMQRATMMDRYDSFRMMSHVDNELGPVPGNATMNQVFFGNNAQSISHDVHRDLYPDSVRPLVVTAANDRSTDAGNLAQWTTDRLPNGAFTSFRVSHTSGIVLWQPFMTPIGHSAGRLDHEWRFVNGLTLGPAGGEMSWPEHFDWRYRGPEAHVTMQGVRQLFLSPLDQALAPMIAQSNHLASVTASACWHEPGYVGPTVRPR
jgi:hypothetical protein